MKNQKSLLSVDWSKLPVPVDDGAARHLMHLLLPAFPLPATDGTLVSLSGLTGRTVLYIYSLTGRPGSDLPDGWDAIPGARGCTPQSCAFRDNFAALRMAGAKQIFGLSTQDTAYQREVVERLQLPFSLLSDAELKFGQALSLPRMRVGNFTHLRRLTMIIDDGLIKHVFYPIFPPDKNASDVLAWLKANPS
jgi:peroxiredoxin